MKVSIAMTTYNGVRYLQEQLDSIIHQSRQPDELIICDDGSTDSTLSILEQFAASAPFVVKIHRNPTNLGCIRNFEKALSFCSGDYIFLSDQDDVWRPNKISTMLAGFECNPNMHLVICDADYTDENLNYSGVSVLQKVIHMGQKKSNHIAGACSAFSKSFLEFVLPFPANCPIHDGYLHRWANLMDNKLVLEESLQVWRIHGQNTSDNNNEMTQPELTSALKRYTSAKDADTGAYCRKKAEDYREMLQMLDNTQKSILVDKLTHIPVYDLQKDIHKIIDAHMQRVELVESGWIMRRVMAVKMLMSGKYRYFKNLLSFAKDILR